MDDIPITSIVARQNLTCQPQYRQQSLPQCIIFRVIFIDPFLHPNITKSPIPSSTKPPPISTIIPNLKPKVRRKNRKILRKNRTYLIRQIVFFYADLIRWIYGSTCQHFCHRKAVRGSSLVISLPPILDGVIYAQWLRWWINLYITRGESRSSVI